MVRFALFIPVFFKYAKWGFTTKTGFWYLGLPFIVCVIVAGQNFLIGMLLALATGAYGMLKSKWPDFYNPKSDDEIVDSFRTGYRHGRSKSKDS